MYFIHLPFFWGFLEVYFILLKVLSIIIAPGAMMVREKTVEMSTRVGVITSNAGVVTQL